MILNIRSRKSFEVHVPQEHVPLELLQKFFVIKRKIHFTLIELLIVLAIIALATGVIGFSASKAIQNERFRSGTNLILDKLQLAQNIMLILKTDAYVTFKHDESKRQVLCFIQVEKQLTPALAKIVNLHPEISGICNVTFVDKETNRQHERDFTLHFISGGTKMSRGYLQLHSGDKTLEQIIYLPGFPHPLGSNSKVLKGHVEANQQTNQYDELYPKEIKKLLEEIRTPI